MTDKAKAAPSKDEAMDELGIANQKIKELEEEVRHLEMENAMLINKHNAAQMEIYLNRCCPGE